MSKNLHQASQMAAAGNNNEQAINKTYRKQNSVASHPSQGQKVQDEAVIGRNSTG